MDVAAIRPIIADALWAVHHVGYLVGIGGAWPHRGAQVDLPVVVVATSVGPALACHSSTSQRPATRWSPVVPRGRRGGLRPSPAVGR